MTLVTKNKDIYERILNGDLNFSEGEIQLEVLVELVALQQLKNLKNINYKALYFSIGFIIFNFYFFYS